MAVAVAVVPLGPAAPVRVPVEGAALVVVGRVVTRLLVVPECEAGVVAAAVHPPPVRHAVAAVAAGVQPDPAAHWNSERGVVLEAISP